MATDTPQNALSKSSPKKLRPDAISRRQLPAIGNEITPSIRAPRQYLLSEVERIYVDVVLLDQVGVSQHTGEIVAQVHEDIRTRDKAAPQTTGLRQGIRHRQL